MNSRHGTPSGKNTSEKVEKTIVLVQLKWTLLGYIITVGGKNTYENTMIIILCKINTTKLDNVEQMSKFLQTHKLPKQTQKK